jgi:hypothetical protein
MLRAARETENMQDNILKHCELDEGGPGFQILKPGL